MPKTTEEEQKGFSERQKKHKSFGFSAKIELRPNVIYKKI